MFWYPTLTFVVAELMTGEHVVHPISSIKSSLSVRIASPIRPLDKQDRIIFCHRFSGNSALDELFLLVKVHLWSAQYLLYFILKLQPEGVLWCCRLPADCV